MQPEHVHVLHSDNDDDNKSTTSSHSRQEQLELEEELKTILAHHLGSTKHPEVQEAIQNLVEVQQQQHVQESLVEPVAGSPYLQGEFLCKTLVSFRFVQRLVLPPSQP